jgi:hypothetical protein
LITISLAAYFLSSSRIRLLVCHSWENLFAHCFHFLSKHIPRRKLSISLVSV